jgi:hypothetical protein
MSAGYARTQATARGEGRRKTPRQDVVDADAEGALRGAEPVEALLAVLGDRAADEGGGGYGRQDLLSHAPRRAGRALLPRAEPLVRDIEVVTDGAQPDQQAPDDRIKRMQQHVPRPLPLVPGDRVGPNRSAQVRRQAVDGVGQVLGLFHGPEERAVDETVGIKCGDRQRDAVVDHVLDHS